MRFSSDFIDKVRDANNIVDIIGHHVQLQKAGSSFRGLCPFPDHVEKTPSFFVNDVKQLYHCFGCKRSGAVFNFLMDFQGLSFPEAVEYLAQRAHIPLPVDDQKITHETKDEKQVLLKLNKYVAALYHRQLSQKDDSHPVKKYLAHRKIKPEIIEEFKLGYSEAGWGDLVGALQRGRAPVSAAEKLGLVKRKQNGEFFDLFRDRLMFPIFSTQGHVVGFGGRTLSDQQPKYLNSHESPIFHKGSTLYGLHTTAKHIRSQNMAFIVEGYMDLLALYQFGIKNVVATLGTAFTADHAKILKRHCSQVVAVFDGDEAGRMASDKSLPVFLEAGLFSKCLTLPDEIDPDDFLNQFGTEAFLKSAEQAPDHFLSLLNRKMLHYKGQPAEKVQLLDFVSPMLNRVTDQRLKSLYLQEITERLEVAPSLVLQGVKSNQGQPADFTAKNINSKTPAKYPREEAILVQFMLEKAEYLELVSSSGAIEMFEGQESRQVAEKISERYCQNPNDFDRLGVLLSGEDRPSELLTSHIGLKALNSELDEAGEKQLILDCLKRVKDRHLKRQSQNILNSLKLESDSSSEKLETFMKIAQEQKGLKGGPDKHG